MSAPNHIAEEGADGRMVVKAGRDVAGYVSPDLEHLGLWMVEGADGQFMGRMSSKEEAAAFLATWFGAEEQE
ncbi:hypothetical protein PUR23_01285 [Methylorubrum populi]|uniref:hypothetical protein n=1 Tax=Methylorubrum populi TaxID=223967 RepID=UPI0031F958D4